MDGVNHNSSEVRNASWREARPRDLPPTEHDPFATVRSGSGVLPEVVVGRVRDLDHGACRCRVAVGGRGVRPPVVSVRWMKLVSTSRSPSGPGVVVADRSIQGMAVGSKVTLSTSWPTA